MMDKAIIFDVGGVLLDYERADMLAVIAGACRPDIGTSHISDLIARLDLSAGINTFEDFYSALKEEYAFTSSFEQLEAAWVEGLKPRTWVPDMLADLSSRATLFVLSDTNAEHWRRVETDILPLQHFETIFLSHELRMTKRSTDVFAHVLREITYGPSECLFVDDTQSNIELASALDIRTHHYQNQASLRDAIESFL